MTVGELRRTLAGIDDNTTVRIKHIQYSNVDDGDGFTDEMPEFTVTDAHMATNYADVLIITAKVR